MDVQEVERRLREDAARFHEQVSEIDVQALTERVLKRIGADPAVADRPAPRCRPR